MCVWSGVSRAFVVRESFTGEAGQGSQGNPPYLLCTKKVEKTIGNTLTTLTTWDI